MVFEAALFPVPVFFFFLGIIESLAPSLCVFSSLLHTKYKNTDFTGKARTFSPQLQRPVPELSLDFVGVGIGFRFGLGSGC